MSPSLRRSDGPPRSPRPALRLRPATPQDTGAVAGIWHAGWRDAHLGRVPDQLVAHRTLPDLTRLARQRVADTIVADVGGERVVGFVVVRDNQLEQLYVAAGLRRQGVASALLARGEAVVAARFDTAWLAVVAGNVTARRFYLGRRWHDAGSFVTDAPTADGPLPVPALRYVKRVHPDTGEATS